MSATYTCDHKGEPIPSRPTQPEMRRSVNIGGFTVRVTFDVQFPESMEWPHLCSSCRDEMVTLAAKEIAK